MKVGSNPFNNGASGRSFDAVFSTQEDGTIVVRSLPRKGNQGRDQAHVPAQSRARVVGKMASKFKNIARNTFTNRAVNRSHVNMFQKANMTASAGVVVDGEIVWNALTVAQGSTASSGLTAVNAALTSPGGIETITADVSWNANANGANTQLKAVVVAKETFECAIIDLGKNQSEAGGSIAVDVTGYEDPILYYFWYDQTEKEASSSLFVFETI